MDGLGTTAQLKGAKAVISSLWEVDDASTGELMADFYQRWAGGKGKVSKVEALREAQLDLLLGKVAPQAVVSARGLGVVNSERKPAIEFGHPYYWGAIRADGKLEVANILSSRAQGTRRGTVERARRACPVLGRHPCLTSCARSRSRIDGLLLLAPTGKARVQMQELAGSNSAIT